MIVWDNGASDKFESKDNIKSKTSKIENSTKAFFKVRYFGRHNNQF